MFQGVEQPPGFFPVPEDWDSEWETQMSADGTLKLFSVLHRKRNARSAKALVVVHGQGEHGGRYLHVPHFVQKEVDFVLCPDLRGHGRSEGLRGHADDFHFYTDDISVSIQALDEKLKKQFGKSEIHVLGHSLGGLIALKMGFDQPNLPIKSMIVTSPALGLGYEIPKWKDRAATLLSTVWGTFHMTNGFDPGNLSHDQDVIAAYCNDRLVHSKGTPTFYMAYKKAVAELCARESGFGYPLLCMVAMQDHIVSAQTTLEFFRNLKLRDKLLKTYPDFYHEILNELGKEQPFEELAQWIHNH